jgi:serine/threonine protein kinase
MSLNGHGTLSRVDRAQQQQLTVAEGLPAYDILRLWAEQSHSRVYEAQEREGKRLPVLVRVSNWPVKKPENRRRFATDVAAATARSTLGNAVRLYGSGFLPTGQAYLVTAHWPSSLGREIDSFGRVTPARAVRIGAEIAFRLARLHGDGVVVGQISPRQVLTAADVATLDVFGVEAMTHPEQPVVVEGTLPVQYWAPEVVRGLPISPVTDVYSLAATLYEALSGRPARWPPDRTPSVGEQLALLDQPLPDLPGVPVALTAVLRRAMSVDPADRQAGMDEFADALTSTGVGPRRGGVDGST